MASVRMSKDLRQRIEQKAYSLFDQPYQRAEKALAEDFGDRLMTEVWADKFEQYIPLIPREWCMETNSIDGFIEGDYKNERQKYHINLSLIKSYTLPAINKFINYSDSYDLKSYTPSQNLFDEYAKYKARKKQVSDERTEFIQKIKNSLTRCNTLKQFLDVWPEGEELIPDEIMTKYNTQAVKPLPRETMDPEITTELSSVLMRRKIGDTIHK